MLAKTLLKSDNPQWSEWSIPEPVAPQQQQPFSQFNQINVRSNKVNPTDVNQTSSRNHKKKRCNFQCKPKQWWSSISPFTRGVLIGVLTGSVMLTIVLPLWLTKLANKTTTTTAGTITLRWNTTGITVAGVANQNGTASNLLNLPIGLALDASNAIYVGDYNANRVQKFPAGSLNATTVAGQANGAKNKTSNNLNFPAGVLVDSSGNIYIADSGNSRIQLWASGASSGSTVAGNSTPGTSNSELNITYGVTRDTNSNTLYVADCGNHRIMAYSSGASIGTLVAGGNGPGVNNTQLNNPSSVYFDSPSDSLIIVNRYAHNIVRWILGDNQWTLIAGSINGTNGTGSTLLKSPFGVTLDPMGNVYVADTSNQRVQLFMTGQSSGITIVGTTDVRGNDSDLLFGPYSVLLDNQLNLYVADRDNHRIQKYLRY